MINLRVVRINVIPKLPSLIFKPNETIIMRTMTHNLIRDNHSDETPSCLSIYMRTRSMINFENDELQRQRPLLAIMIATGPRHLFFH